MRRPNRPGAKSHQICTKCGTRKQISYRYRLLPAYSAENYVCFACRPPAQRRQYPESKRRHWLWRAYRMTPEDYDRMLAAQGGVCAICKRPPKANRLHVDHDHSHCPGKTSCGKCIRGLLCVSCNSKLEWWLGYHSTVEGYLRRDVICTGSI